MASSRSRTSAAMTDFPCEPLDQGRAEDHGFALHEQDVDVTGGEHVTEAPDTGSQEPERRAGKLAAPVERGEELRIQERPYLQGYPSHCEGSDVLNETIPGCSRFHGIGRKRQESHSRFRLRSHRSHRSGTATFVMGVSSPRWKSPPYPGHRSTSRSRDGGPSIVVGSRGLGVLDRSPYLWMQLYTVRSAQFPGVIISSSAKLRAASPCLSTP